MSWEPDREQDEWNMPRPTDREAERLRAERDERQEERSRYEMLSVFWTPTDAESATRRSRGARQTPQA